MKPSKKTTQLVSGLVYPLLVILGSHEPSESGERYSGATRRGPHGSRIDQRPPRDPTHPTMATLNPNLPLSIPRLAVRPWVKRLVCGSDLRRRSVMRVQGVVLMTIIGCEVSLAHSSAARQG
jgi:hypothetical protein